MIIFQHSISYSGTAAESTRVNTTIKVPILGCTAETDDGQVWRQFGDEAASVSFTQPANQTSYLGLPTRDLSTGDTETGTQTRESPV